MVLERDKKKYKCVGVAICEWCKRPIVKYYNYKNSSIFYHHNDVCKDKHKNIPFHKYRFEDYPNLHE